MTGSRDYLNGIKGDADNPPEIVITESAGRMIIMIEEILDYLISREDLNPADDISYGKFREVLDLYELLQIEVLAASNISSVCKTGCKQCCCHWVEDVSSLEGAIISRYLKENHPALIDRIIGVFREDTGIFESLCVSSDDNIPEYHFLQNEADDFYSLLLSRFYQLNRPCALLDKNGRCIAYPVHPLTCRDYFNIRDSSACLPERINDENNATLIIYLSDTIAQKVEILHRRFDDGSNDKSLRRLLVRIFEHV
jgi:Fe-S-cluster containining protein